MTPSQSKIKAWREGEEEAETESERGRRVEVVERFLGLRKWRRVVWESRKEEEGEEKVIVDAMAWLG